MLNIVLNNAMNKLETTKLYYFQQYEYLAKRIAAEKRKFGFGYWAERYALWHFDKEGKIEEIIPKEYLGIIKKNIKILEEKSEDKKTRSIGIRLLAPDKLKSKKIELSIPKASDEYRKHSQMGVIHDNNALILLIIKFEEFISELFRKLITKYPEKYLHNQQITYAQIIKVDTEKMREKLISQTIESIMRERLGDWIKKFESHKINFDNFKEYYEDFKELYYRRNIIVHNKGRVNECYINGVDASRRQGIQPGSILNANKEYMENAFCITEAFIYHLVFEFLKIEKDEIEENLDAIFMIGFNHLQKQEWIVARHVFNLLKDCKDANESFRTMSRVNYWIAVKNRDGVETISDDVKEFDVSALNASFHLAKVALLNDFEKTEKYLEALFPKEIDVEALKTWPLFIQFRESKQYIAFVEKHSAEFEIQCIGNPESGAKES